MSALQIMNSVYQTKANVGSKIYQSCSSDWRIRIHCRTTVRSKEKASELQSTFPSLILYEADLLQQGSFDECFAGVDYVIHAASPFQLKVTDPQTELIDPALEGTKNVLSSVTKNLNTIKKVVVTSSVAAILQEYVESGKVYSENDWNTSSDIKNSPYRLSKVLAEKAAWDWWKEKEDTVQLMVVNPAFVLGAPRLKRSDSTSIKTLIDLFNGSQLTSGVSGICNGVTDIRNVAQAHIACIEKQNISGRFLVSSPVSYSRLDFVDLLKKFYPQYTFPDKFNGELSHKPEFNIEKSKKELDIQFYPLEETLKMAADRLMEFGLIERK